MNQGCTNATTSTTTVATPTATTAPSTTSSVGRSKKEEATTSVWLTRNHHISYLSPKTGNQRDIQRQRHYAHYRQLLQAPTRTDVPKRAPGGPQARETSPPRSARKTSETEAEG